MYNHQELITAHPRHDVRATQTTFDPLRTRHQHFIARIMAIGIINVFEMVEIDVDQSEAVTLFVALRNFELLLVLLHKVASIWQLR